jgi:biotin carboxyl carrier protein
VTAGQPVITLSAMKMEIVCEAPAAGRVKSIRAAAGLQVEAAVLLVAIDITSTPPEER